MAEKTLQRNVKVGDDWYGPAWPDNKVTAEVRKALEDNPLAWEAPQAADAAGTPFGPRLAGEGDPDPGSSLQPLTEANRSELENLSDDDLKRLAEARDVKVRADAKRGAIIDRLIGKGE
ncbi:MAG: hypothetical protein LC798_16700 [Chloroflexi bacterium]|nr:hypothetical protein [Chloroflexota bacterium]